MADINDKVVTDSVLKKAITEVLQVVAENTFNFVEYESDEVNALFDVESPEKLAYYESLINPDLISENRLWASKTIADKIAEAILQANEYSDDLIKNISSIQLEWCETSLPVTGETNKIYILPVTSGSDTVNTLNIWNSKTSAYVSIGNLEIDLSQYYTKSEIDTKLNDKANKSEVLAVNKVQTTTGSETNDTVYSSKLTKDELDKKANDSEVVKKTDIATSISSTSTNDKVAGAKAVHDSLANKLDKTVILTTADEVNSFDREYQSFIIEPSVAEAVGLPKAPDSTWFCINLSHVKDFKYPSQIAFEYAGIERIMYRTAHNGVWHNWRKIPTTTVDDVPKTNITTNSDTTYYEIEQAHSFYIVKNGICTVNLVITCNSVNDDWVQVVYNMPKPLEQLHFSTGNMYDSSLDLIYAKIETDCIIKLRRGGVTSGAKFYWLSFSYQVAE